jgi:hypothetical protein
MLVLVVAAALLPSFASPSAAPALPGYTTHAGVDITGA